MTGTQPSTHRDAGTHEGPKWKRRPLGLCEGPTAHTQDSLRIGQPDLLPPQLPFAQKQRDGSTLGHGHPAQDAHTPTTTWTHTGTQTTRSRHTMHTGWWDPSPPSLCPHTHKPSEPHTLPDCCYARGHTHTQCSHRKHRNTLDRHCQTSQIHMPLPTHICTREVSPTQPYTHETDIHGHKQSNTTETCPLVTNSQPPGHMSPDPEASPHTPATAHGCRRAAINSASSANCQPRTHARTHTPPLTLIPPSPGGAPKAPTENTGLT